jgi:hypothetical protein
MLDQQLLILAEVIVKLFSDNEHRLPEEKDVEYIATAIIKTYKAGLAAQNVINKLK